MTQVTDLLAYLDRNGGKVWLENQKLKYFLPLERPDLLEQLRTNKTQILEALTLRSSDTQPLASQAPSSFTLESTKLEVSPLWDVITSNLTELATELRQRLNDYPSMVMMSEWVDTQHIRHRTYPKPITSRVELEELIQTTRATTPANAVYVALRVAHNPLEPQTLYVLAGNGTALYNAHKTEAATAEAALNHKLELIKAISDLGYNHAYSVTPINGVYWYKVRAWQPESSIDISVRGTDYTLVLEDVVHQCKRNA